MKETFMSVEVEDLRTSKSWIEQLSVIPAENGKCVEIPENFAPFGEVRFKGDFKGFMNDFVAFGVLSSDIGKVRTNVSFKRENEAGEIAWNGKLETKDLDMGALLGTSAMGPLNSTLEVDATGMTMERIRADIEGDVDRFRINGYDYHNMRVEGIFEQHRFQGMIRGSGEHYDLDFKGMVDLASARPQFEFTANMAGDPTHLNLGDRDSSAHLSLRMEVDASGNRPENVRGKVEIRDILYEEKGRQYPFADILVEARENEDQQTLSFRSGFLEATFQGKFKTAQLADDLTRQVYQALPALRDRPPLQLSPDQHFDFRFKVGDTEQLSELFFPDIRMASNAVLEGKYDSDEGRFEFICFIPKLELYGRSFRGTKLTVNKVGDTLQVQGTGEALQATKDVAFKDLRLDARAARDCVQVSADWGQTGRTERNEFAFTTLVKGTDHFELDIGSGRFFFGGLEWGLNENGRVLIDSSSYMADRVELTHEDRFIKINGKASRDPADRMTLNVNDFRLSYLAPLIGAEETELGGVVNLKGGVSNVYEKPEIDASAEVTELVFNDTPLGDLTLNGEWLDAQKKMTLSGGLKRDGKERLNIAGAYRTAEGVEPLNVALKARKLDLAFMNAFLAGGVSGFRGSVDGQLDLTGSLDAPVVTGGITTKGVSVLIDHLNTRYFIQDESKIRFHEEMITMDYVPIFDEEDHEARATATVVHQHFSDWNYNLFVEQMDDFLCMNTTKDMNDLYYGTGYVDGEAEVSGYGDQLNIQVTAKTEKGTRINIPLSGSKKVTQENFIEFVDHQDTGKVEARDVNLEGVDMSFELDVTPDANFRLIFDETVGDVMEGRGSGNINMEIDSKGKFEMFGQYTVKEGEYLFTLRDVINKRFQVESGGTIQWFGDPYKAALDLNANYSLRSSLYDVIPAGVSDRSSYSKRVPVNLVMHLSNNLTDPDIDFDIELPTVGDDTRSLVQSSMDTEEKVNQQAFSLLLLGRFIPQMKASDRSADAGFSQNTSTELLSNQLSNWLSSISDEFDIGVNYRPGNAISSEEVAVAMSTKLFNDRLTLSGNFGVSSDDQVQKQDQSVVVGDFRAEYDITEDGKFRLKAYNESNDNRLSALDQADYTQGVGIFYREEFDTAAELINKMGGLFRREEKKKEKAD